MENPAWNRGSDSTGTTTFVMEVRVKVDAKGGVQSYRSLQSDEDLELAQSLPNGGLEFASFCLLQEALRQECLFQALLLMSAKKDLDPEVLQFSLEETVSRYLKAISQEVVSQTIGNLSREHD